MSSTPPSPWLLRWQHLLKPGLSALDLACGAGRHLRHLAGRGLRLTGVDRDAAALEALQGLAVELIVADIEAGPWPLAGRRFDLVLVSNYLWRPLLPQMLDSVAPGGLLIYETFGDGQQTIGRPARADFLLQPGELLQACAAAGLRVIAYEDGFEALDPVNPRYVQRVAAVREAPGSGAGAGIYPRYDLSSGESPAALQ